MRVGIYFRAGVRVRVTVGLGLGLELVRGETGAPLISAPLRSALISDSLSTLHSISASERAAGGLDGAVAGGGGPGGDHGGGAWSPSHHCDRSATAALSLASASGVTW